LPGKGASYEVDETMDAGLRPRQSLIVRMPEAFTAPRKLVVEALWHQPQFASQAAGRIDVSLPSRHIEGMNWQMVGGIQPHRDSPLRDDVSALTQLLAWKAKATLDRDELVALLAYLGTPSESPFSRVIPWLKEVAVTTVPDSAQRGSGIRHTYDITLEPFEATFVPLVVCFLDQVRELLDVWNNEATVDLRASVAGVGPLPLTMAS
jgi:type VI secretion system protein ImpG